MMNSHRYQVKSMGIVNAQKDAGMAKERMNSAQRDLARAQMDLDNAASESRALLDELGEKYGFNPREIGVTTAGEVVPKMMLQGRG